MPQPLSKVKKISYAGYGALTMLQRPEMAIQISRVISAWAMTEVQQARLITLFLKSDVRVGVSMFLGVVSTEAKRVMLDRAAKASLLEADYDLYALVAKAISSVRRRRNEFAHGVWGSSEDLPDYLLWLPADEFLSRDVEMHEARIRGDQETLKAIAQSQSPKTMAYSMQDLNDEVLRANEATNCIMLLVTALSKRGEKSDAARKSIMASPFIVSQTKKQSTEPRTNL